MLLHVLKELSPTCKDDAKYVVFCEPPQNQDGTQMNEAPASSVITVINIHGANSSNPTTVTDSIGFSGASDNENHDYIDFGTSDLVNGFINENNVHSSSAALLMLHKSYNVVLTSSTVNDCNEHRVFANLDALRDTSVLATDFAIGLYPCCFGVTMKVPCPAWLGEVYYESTDDPSLGVHCQPPYGGAYSSCFHMSLFTRYQPLIVADSSCSRR